MFRDINDNQATNTSHLDGITVKLTPEEELKRREPELFIAQRLSRDSKSPLYGKVFEGGKRPPGADIPLRGLKTGVEYMLSRSTQLPHLEDPEAQFKVIRNYVEAVKKRQPKAWTHPKDYIVLRGAGLWAVFFIGAQVTTGFCLKRNIPLLICLRSSNLAKSGIGAQRAISRVIAGVRARLKLASWSQRSCMLVTRFQEQLFDKIMAEK